MKALIRITIVSILITAVIVFAFLAVDFVIEHAGLNWVMFGERTVRVNGLILNQRSTGMEGFRTEVISKDGHKYLYRNSVYIEFDKNDSLIYEGMVAEKERQALVEWKKAQEFAKNYRD